MSKMDGVTKKVNDAIQDIRTQVDGVMFGPNDTTTADPNTVYVGDSTTGTDITIDPGGSIPISSGQIFIDSGSSDGWYNVDTTVNVKIGPWEFQGSENGDVAIVFDKDDKRVEYHIEKETIVAMLEKVAAVKIEGKKEDV